MTEVSRIGTKIITVRESLGLSCDDLAERSGCDVVLIRRIEEGELVPSLAPLVKISRALGVRLGTLLDDDMQVGPVVTRAADAEEVVRLKSLETGTAAGTLDFFSLAAGKSARHMEPFLIDVNASDERSLSSHEGEEFLYVLAGELAVEYGKETHTLGAGDSIYYDSIVPHQVRAAGSDPARILAVVYAPA
ncbi:MAG: cupin domain-containing protein [Coriobacteriia bacterium]|nr:cupin domain-containing protein [Coriobacteriia bacterium]